MWSHLLLLSKFLCAKFSYFNRNPCIKEFCVRMKDFPTDFTTDQVRSNRKMLGLKAILWSEAMLQKSIHYWQCTFFCHWNFIKNSLMWPLVCLDWCKMNLNHTKLKINLIIIQKPVYSGRCNLSSDEHQQICTFYHCKKKLRYLSPFNSAQKWIHFIPR